MSSSHDIRCLFWTYAVLLPMSSLNLLLLHMYMIICIFLYLRYQKQNQSGKLFHSNSMISGISPLYRCHGWKACSPQTPRIMARSTSQLLLAVVDANYKFLILGVTAGFLTVVCLRIVNFLCSRKQDLEYSFPQAHSRRVQSNPIHDCS